MVVRTVLHKPRNVHVSDVSYETYFIHSRGHSCVLRDIQ